jgi:hypothetical protein
VIEREDPDEEIKEGIDVPRVAKKEKLISTKDRLCVLFTPAVPLPPRVFVNENIALVPVDVDFTAVPLNKRRLAVSPDVVINSVFDEDVSKCVTPVVTVVHG